MTWKELNKLAYERYPVTEKERTCWQEKQRRNELREAYKKRLAANNPFESGQVQYDDKREKFYEIGEIGIELKFDE